MSFKIGSFIAALFFLALATWAQGKAVAMVSDLKGLLRCGASNLALFDACFPGQVFQAAPGSSWTLSFVQAGRRVSGG